MRQCEKEMAMGYIAMSGINLGIAQASFQAEEEGERLNYEYQMDSKEIKEKLHYERNTTGDNC